MKTLKLVLYFLFATLITSLLPFSGIFMPVFLVLSAALFVALSVKWNYIYSLFSAAFSGLLIYFTFDFATGNISGILFAIIFSLIPFLSATGIFTALKLKASVRTVLLSGTVSYFLLIAFFYIVYGSSFITDMINMVQSTMFESLDSVVHSIPADSTEMVAEIRKMYELYFENLKVVAPSIILSLFFLLSYFTIKVSGRMAKNEPAYENIPSFSNLRAPAFMLVITAAAYFGQLAENAFFSGLMANIFMVLSVYYTLCGFSLIDFFAKLRIKKLSIRLTIYVAGILFLTMFSLFLYFVNPILIAMFGGMIDSLFNYRIRIKSGEGK